MYDNGVGTVHGHGSGDHSIQHEKAGVGSRGLLKGPSGV